MEKNRAELKLRTIVEDHSPNSHTKVLTYPSAAPPGEGVLNVGQILLLEAISREGYMLQ